MAEFDEEQDDEEQGIENNDMPKEKIPSYEEMVTEEPEREIDVSTLPKTVSEEEDETPSMSDIKYIIDKLTPKYKDKKLNEKLQSVHVSRIFPDNLLDSCKMTVLSWLNDQDPTKSDIDIWGTILAAHGAHSIGYEGRGIVDRLEIAGVAHEEEMAKLSKDLGLG